MKRYKVISIGTRVLRESRTEPVIQNGRQTGTKEIEFVFRIGQASDGRDKFVYDFRFEPDTVVVGDIISATESTRNPGTLEDVFVEVPAPGSQNRVALNPAPPLERILPLPKTKADSIDVLELATESGHELNGADIRDLCSRFLVLEAEVKKLKACRDAAV